MYTSILYHEGYCNSIEVVQEPLFSTLILLVPNYTLVYYVYTVRLQESHHNDIKFDIDHL